MKTVICPRCKQPFNKAEDPKDDDKRCLKCLDILATKASKKNGK